MKLKTLILLVLTLGLCSAFGQFIYLGGGLNLSTLGTEDVTKAHRSYKKAGYNAGINYEQFFTNNIGAVLGVSYETRGEGGFIGSIGNKASEDSSWSYSYKYLQVPIHIVTSFPIDNHRIEILAGIEVGYKIGNGEYRLEGRDSVDYPVTYNLFYPDSTAEIIGDKDNDYGISIGVGYKLEVPFGAMYIRPSYYQSLQDLNASGKKHRNFKIQLGYGFRIF